MQRLQDNSPTNQLASYPVRDLTDRELVCRRVVLLPMQLHYPTIIQRRLLVNSIYRVLSWHVLYCNFICVLSYV